MTRPFRPSNGTCGDVFMSAFCHRCWRMAEDGRKPCEILGRVLFSTDPVPEWVQDDDGDNARCMAFQDVDKPEPSARCEKTQDMFSSGMIVARNIP